MVVTLEITLKNKICPKCGSKMAYRRRIFHNRPTLLLQCIVCRHYVVVETPNNKN